MEAIIGAKQNYPGEGVRISDLASSLYFTWDGFAFLLFPTMGGYLSDQLGFPSEMEIVALILLINALVFTVSAGYDLANKLP